MLTMRLLLHFTKLVVVVVCFVHLLLLHLYHTQELSGCDRWLTDGRHPNGKRQSKARTKEKKVMTKPRKQMKMTVMKKRREGEEKKEAGAAGGVLRAFGADAAGDEEEDEKDDEDDEIDEYDEGGCSVDGRARGGGNWAQSRMHR
jgi:hypothetical protein